jgi:hypothetical protein
MPAKLAERGHCVEIISSIVLRFPGIRVNMRVNDECYHANNFRAGQIPAGCDHYGVVSRNPEISAWSSRGNGGAKSKAT